MSTTITTINATDLITNSRDDINNNFSSLNTNKIETSYIDTDTSLTANSDSKIPTQKAIKTYVDTVAQNTYIVATGNILPYTGTSAPANYLLCDGSAISRSTYSTLFSLIGTAYGTGNGSTTFNLPLPPVPSSLNYSSVYTSKFVAASSHYLSKSSPTGTVTGDFTITATLSVSLFNSVNHFIYARGGSSGNYGYNFYLNDNGTGLMSLRLNISSNGTTYTTVTCSSTYQMTLGTFYHLAVSYVASTGIATFYVNNQVLGTGTGGPSSIFNTTGDMWVGCENSSTNTAQSFFDGNIANIKVFNAALGQTAISASMNYMPTTNCIAAWTLNNTYADSTINGNTLTAHNSATFEQKSIITSPFYYIIKT